MCVKSNYNNILEQGTSTSINNFMDNCETCVKYGSCDYLGNLEDKLKELEK